MDLFLAHVLTAPVLYLDPGSGSLLIQLLIAAVLGVGVAVKIYWRKIKGLFTGKKDEITTITEEKDEE